MENTDLSRRAGRAHQFHESRRHLRRICLYRGRQPPGQNASLRSHRRPHLSRHPVLSRIPQAPAVLNGTVIINNPFWWSADDKFFNYSLADKLGVAVPPTVILPHKHFPPGTTERSIMRNLEIPSQLGECLRRTTSASHPSLKPVDGGGWKGRLPYPQPARIFPRLRPQPRSVHVLFQKAVNFKEYFRCYVVGQEKVRIMPYDPRRPHAERLRPRSASLRILELLSLASNATSLTLCQGARLRSQHRRVRGQKTESPTPSTS